MATSENRQDDGHQAWLARHPLKGSRELNRSRRSWRACLSACHLQDMAIPSPLPGRKWIPDSRDTPPEAAPERILALALGELRDGLSRVLGLRMTPALLSDSTSGPVPGGLILGSFRSFGIAPPASSSGHDTPEAFVLRYREGSSGEPGMVLAADDSRGFLQGIFRLLEDVAQGRDPASVDRSEAPANSLRMVNHWDNMDGSVERGYAGHSLFFRDNRIRFTLGERRRIMAYARLLSSAGINGLTINNVNVHHHETGLILDALLPRVADLAAIFRVWGIRLFLSANYASPLHTGAVDTADPLDPRVEAWWTERCKIIYRHIRDFGGFVVKADSEGRPGPFTYGRTHAEGANMMARALAPHSGVLIWRCFVYNCRQDWRDRKTDRARAAGDHFLPLDGSFAPNVILQIKNGPIDFQTREPVSPLFAGLQATNMMLELQATQEYTGQQRHVFCLPFQWKDYLDFDIRTGGVSLAAVASGKTTRRPLGGMAAVVNTGDDANWCGHHLAQMNLWGFGRLAWDPGVSPDAMVDTWTCLSFGHDRQVTSLISRILRESRAAYEGYTAPLAVGFMVNPGHHYGPNVDGYEYDRWGTYHFADRDGIGVDRTCTTGTGYAGQYASPWKERYESLSSCPDDVLLFFHHVPWNHRLHSGKTVMQHIYDTHFAGAATVAAWLQEWKKLEGLLPSRIHREIMERLEHQTAHALEWRDQINTYCFRKSGIPDEKGRIIY